MSSTGPRQGMVITHPNREKAVVRTTRVVVIALVLASVALVLLVSIGGAGAQDTSVLPIQYGFVLVYLIVAWLAVRWRRGSLPVVSAIAVFLAIFALVSGSSWFEREHSYFGAANLSPDLVGILTFAIVPVQALLILFAMRGFSQGWNVELESPVGAGGGGRRRASAA